MEDLDSKCIYVVGHKNPDTDSICSAIAYAELKNRLTGGNYVAMRAGHTNEETQYVLKRFNVGEPQLLSDVRTQIKDVRFNKIKGVESGISMKNAWELMKKNNVVTLPITKGKELEGLITIGDITTSYMDVYDNRILATAHTQYKNIIETLNAKMVIGNEDRYFVTGKVLIAAANPDLMESFIEEDDLVILGNRYESQLCAIEMKAGCIVVCDGANISLTIRKIAEERDCVVISTPYDPFTVARLINQSIPIKYFMRKEKLITFHTDDYIEDIREIMAKKRHRDFPVLDKNDCYIGMISRRNFLDADRKQVILVDHNEYSQAVDGILEAEIVEIIDHHRLGTMETISPVFFRSQPLGCTATILYQMYRENKIDIDRSMAGLLCSAIVSDTLLFRSPTCTKLDRDAAEALAFIAGVSTAELAAEIFKAGSNLKNLTAAEICNQDFKIFTVGDVSFGVGQINSMEQEELDWIKLQVDQYLRDDKQKWEVDMRFFMLTNIVEESTELLCYGQNSSGLVEESFNCTSETNSYRLKGVVSRKKQLIPAFVIALQH